MRLLKLILVFTILALLGVMAAVAAVAYALRAQKPWAIHTATTITAGRLDNQRTVATRIEASLEPTSGRLEAHASLTLESLEPGREWFAFLLNPGLKVANARINGAEARVHRLWCLAMLQSPVPVDKGKQVTLDIEYAGTATNGGLADGWTGASETVLPMLAFWHPLDLKSFSDFECRLTVPAGYGALVGSATTATTGDDGRTRVAWRYPRPVLGATMAVGRFDRKERMQGTLVCGVHWSAATDAPPEALLDAAGAAHGTLSAMYGTDGFDRLDLLVSPQVTRPVNAGSSFLLVPPDLARDMENSDSFVALASLVAQNWWGNTVGARWLASRPDGHAWLTEGMTRYAAWRVLRDRRGKIAFLRLLEAHPPVAGQAIKQVLRTDADAEPPAVAAVVSSTGPYIPLILENALGRETVDAACHNLIAVHRYTAIGYPALAQELQLASETPLDEFFTDWIERRVDFDYAIEGVETRPDGLLLRVVSPGRTPCSGKMTVALLGDSGVVFHTIEPAALGGEFTLPATAAVEQVILDPFFAFPDLSRSNNVWPRRSWPCGATRADDGRTAVLAKSEWSALYPDSVTVLNPASGIQERMTLRQPVTDGLRWLHDGRLLVPTDTGALVWFTGIPMRSAPAVEATKAHKLRTLASECCAVEPAGACVPTADGAAYVGVDGTLRECISGEKRCETLLELDFPVREAEAAPDLSAVAWRDPAGNLRVTPVNDPAARYVYLPGEVIDFSWDGVGKNLLVLVAETPSELPMRCHARHSLWTVAVPSMTVERLDVPDLDRS